MTLMRNALAAGAEARAYDSVAAANLNKEMPDVATVSNMYDVLDGADALVICTEWPEFRQPDFEEISRRLREPVIFDGRNIYRREHMLKHGFTYYSVGRPPVNDKRRGFRRGGPRHRRMSRRAFGSGAFSSVG